ncbi:MAG: hypothetical protein LAO55_08970 [Acidobacteriia bacterium]|nr:hypothetical protein [Terriglobia bacterium]
MKRIVFASTVALLLTCTGLWAHHSYSTFYLMDHRVTLKGRVSKVSFLNPHVMLTIETKNSGTWQAEWTNVDSLARQGVRQETVQTGDFLEIEGSPARDPDSRVVSALTEIRRPADAWRWVRPDSRTIE